MVCKYLFPLYGFSSYPLNRVFQKAKMFRFDRSLDGYGDLNGDSITDVSVGAFGQVIQLWWVSERQTQISYRTNGLLSREDCCASIIKTSHALYKTLRHLYVIVCIEEGICFSWWEEKNICLTLESSFSSLYSEQEKYNEKTKVLKWYSGYFWLLPSK